MKLLKTVSLVAGLALLCSIGVAEDKIELPAKENFHLYLLVGQSNMAGRGKVTPEDKKPQEGVLMLTKELKWVPATDPMHFDKKIAGVGLGRTFGIEMSEEDSDVTVGLIPCAVGGSPILAWEPGGYHESTKTHPWDDMMPRAKAALESEEDSDVTVGLIPCAVGGSPILAWEPGGYHESTKTHPWDDMMPRAKAALEKGTLKGILWHQGESDSKETLAPDYDERLHALVKRFRKELNAPKVPFIAGAMGNWPERPWDEWKTMVDRVHRDLPKKVSYSAYVSADELQHRDKVHFNRESYIEFGKRYAAAYREVIKDSP